jgi:hypothetical protein
MAGFDPDKAEQVAEFEALETRLWDEKGPELLEAITTTLAPNAKIFNEHIDANLTVRCPERSTARPFREPVMRAGWCPPSRVLGASDVAMCRDRLSSCSSSATRTPSMRRATSSRCR